MIPYSLRPFIKPGGEGHKYDESVYTPELHAQNIALLEKTLQTHAGNRSKTPWLTSGIGIVAVEHSGLEYDFTSVYLANDHMAYAQGLHFVRQDITVHREEGIRARTRIYPTLQRVVQLFTTPDAARSMMYPTLNRHPAGASAHMKEWLTATHELEPATPRGLREIFPERRFALRHWVGVKIK